MKWKFLCVCVIIWSLSRIRIKQTRWPKYSTALVTSLWILPDSLGCPSTGRNESPDTGVDYHERRTMYSMANRFTCRRSLTIINDHPRRRQVISPPEVGTVRPLEGNCTGILGQHAGSASLLRQVWNSVLHVTGGVGEVGVGRPTVTLLWTFHNSWPDVTVRNVKLSELRRPTIIGSSTDRVTDMWYFIY